MGNDSDKRTEFKQLLFELAQTSDLFDKGNAEKRRGIYRRFEDLYGSDTDKKRFRHYYSDIFDILVQIRQSPDIADTGTLLQNLSLLQERYRVHNKKDITLSLRKLLDHVNLDISRIEYYSSLDDNVSGEAEIQNLQARIADLTNRVAEANKRTELSEHKLENVQKEYVAILSIFATVIMAISGGLAISKETLAGVSSLNIWNLLAVFSFVGWMLLNLLFLLLHYISQILDRDKKLKYDYLVFVNLVMLLIVTAMLLYRSWDAILVPMN